MTDPEQEPQRIRKSRSLLGLESEPVTNGRIIAAWKQKLAEPPKTTHIENDEHLICLNEAKQTLLDWINKY